MEDILALILIFGGGAVVAIAFSPIGRALADRLRHGKVPPESNAPAVDPALYEELDQLRAEMSELQERVDFTERLLVKGSTPEAAKESS